MRFRSSQRGARGTLLARDRHDASLGACVSACAIAFAACGTIVACGTFDYGDAPVDEVEVSTTNPNWAFDIKPLMQLKCMNCHTDKPGRFVPGDADPIKLDDEATFRKLAERVEVRVFKTPAKPMPPTFGTPLNQNELAALKKFLAELKAALPKPTPAPTLDPAKPKVKFSEVSAVFASTCATAQCHAAGKEDPPLTTLAEIKAKRARVEARVGTGSMPPANATKQPTADEAKKMVEWAQGGTDD